MSFYVRPLFSLHHAQGALIKKLGSSDLEFSVIEILRRKNGNISKKIIQLRDLNNLENEEKKIIEHHLKNIQKKMKNN